MTAPSDLTTAPSRIRATAALSLAFGLMALIGYPARSLMKMAGPESSMVVALGVGAFQFMLGVAAVVLGLKSKGLAGQGRRPASAWAGVATGALALVLSALLLVLLTFNTVSKSTNRSVVETKPVVLQPSD